MEHLLHVLLCFALFTLDDAGSISEMTARQVKNRVLGAHAVGSVVGILVNVVLLTHAERINHLAHLLAWIWSHDPLSYLVHLFMFLIVECHRPRDHAQALLCLFLALRLPLQLLADTALEALDLHPVDHALRDQVARNLVGTVPSDDLT